MAHQFGVSGSTIFTEASLFENLFWEGADHVEIGEFKDEADFEHFMMMLQEKGVSFGLHSPLLRSGSKYDLIEPVYNSCETAWLQVEREAERMASLGARYMLVHFPFFTGETEADTAAMIEGGLERLKRIQEANGLPIVCEPKLGPGKNGAGIRYLHGFPAEKWAQYGIGMCVDIGDYLIAAGDEVMDFVEKWAPMIRVVHLHHVRHRGEKYNWIPVHPQHEIEGDYRIEPILRRLAELRDLYFIFEHTPDTDPDPRIIEEGFGWTRALVQEACRHSSDPCEIF